MKSEISINTSFQRRGTMFLNEHQNTLGEKVFLLL